MRDTINSNIERELQKIHCEIQKFKNKNTDDLFSYFMYIKELSTFSREAVSFLKENKTIISNYQEKIDMLLKDIEYINFTLENTQNSIHEILLHQYNTIFDYVNNRRCFSEIVKVTETMNSSIQSFFDFFNDDNKRFAKTIVKKLDFINKFYKIHNIDDMSGQNFENYCANLLIAYGFKNIEITKGSGDQGVDIIGYYDGFKIAVQCKRYSKKLTNSPIQEVVAGKYYYSCQGAMVITNNYFTDSAIELAKANKVVLWDRDKLTSRINNYIESQWDKLLEKIKMGEDNA